MFADDLVIDVQYFQNSHPGGKYMIAEAIGEDTGKYMTGCSSYGGNFQPYTHSETAFSFLRYLAIARIPYPEGYIISTTNEPVKDFMEFQIYSQVRLNEQAWLLTLKSDFYEVDEKCDVKWLGKHFKIINNEKIFGKVRRYYSSVFVNIENWCKEVGVGVESQSENESDRPGCIKLIYKAFPGGAMSQYLLSLKCGDVVTVKGPLGPGLMLTELKGNYLAFAGGTGLVPFLDLLYLIWQQRDELVNFQFTLYVSFRSENDSIFLNLLRKLQEKISRNVFRLIIITQRDEVTPQLGQLLVSFSTIVFNKIWICGPSGFSRTIHTLLVTYGIQKSLIVMM